MNLNIQNNQITSVKDKHNVDLETRFRPIGKLKFFLPLCVTGEVIYISVDADHQVILQIATNMIHQMIQSRIRIMTTTLLQVQTHLTIMK